MMKGFNNVFKMLGLATLAIGLMVTGCADPSSDEASAVQGAVNQGAFTIPVTVNPSAASVTFGNGANSATGVFDGHTIEVQTVSCSGTGIASDHTNCTIRVINRDSNEFMTNATLFLSYCVDCSTSPNFHNADCTGLNTASCARPAGLVEGATVAGVFVDGKGLNTDTAIAQVNGFCLAEDGQYSGFTAPYTTKGCLGYTTVMGDGKPAQHLAPTCGYRDVKWDFFNNSGLNFRFYANVTSQWHPIDLLADTRVLPADFDDYTTLVLQIVDLDHKMCGGVRCDRGIEGATANFLWRVGSSRHSTVLAGLANHTTTLKQGKYFALNVDAEYPNRIENYSPGRPAGAGFTNYEYYVMYNFIIRFDPAVVSPVTSSGPIRGGSLTFVTVGGIPQCRLCAHGAADPNNQRMYESVTSLEDMGGTNSVVNQANKGIVYGFVNINTSSFSWNPAATLYYAAQTYFETGATFSCAENANIWPLNAGQHGLVHINRTVEWPCTSRTVPDVFKTSFANAIVDDGPDADTDMEIGMFHFKVVPVGGGSSPVGLGTMFWPEQHSTSASYVTDWTANTAAGGSSVGSDDWILYCMPFNMANNNSVQQGCPPIGTPIIQGGVEQSNPHLGQTGFSTPAGGMYMGNSVSFCVSL